MAQSLTNELYLQKLEELRQLEQILGGTQQLADGLESMVAELGRMASGADKVAYLLANWKSVTQATQLGSLGGGVATDSGVYTAPLVRYPLDDPEQTTEP